MAYSYDYRPYDHRRHDSFAQYSRNPAPQHASLRPDGHSYEYGYSYPRPSPTPRSASYHPSLPERRSRRRWPPSPSVEDEKESLARELDPTTLRDDENGGEACMRGTVDQEPIMLEVEQPQPQPPRAVNSERRFVLVTSDNDGSRTTDQRSEKRKPAQDERTQPPPLKTDLDEIPIFTRREPTPYSYSKTPTLSSNRSSGEYFLSPGVITPTSAITPRSVPNPERPVVTSKDSTTSVPRAGRGPATARSPRYSAASSPKYGLSEYSDSDSDSDSVGLRSKRNSTRYSYTKADLLEIEHESAVRDTFIKSSQSAQRLGQSSGAQFTNPSSKIPQPRSPHSPYGQGHVGAVSGTSSYGHNLPSAQQSSSARTATATMTGGVSRHQSSRSSPPLPSSTSCSSRAPLDKGDYVKRDGKQSRPGSRPGSRAPSPLSSEVTPPERTSTFPLVKGDRSRPASRHDSVVRQDTMPTSTGLRTDVHSASTARPAKPGNPLPYPDDDMAQLMPEEERFQFMPRFRRTSTDPSAHPRPSSGIATPQSAVPPKFPVSRPVMQTRSSLPEGVPKLRSDSSRLSSSSDSSRSGSKSSSGASRALPPCPRSEYSEKYDEWYTLNSQTTFDVCPDCLNSIIWPTPFRKYFRRAPRRPAGMKTKCDFSSPWVRLAWLLTQKRKYGDIDLIYALADLDASKQTCPGSTKTLGPWYTLCDPSGSEIRNLYICPCDKKYLEVLFPSLKGLFMRVPQTDPTDAQLCSLRTESRRFAAYLDLLVEIDEKATKNRRAPDLRALAELVRDNASKQECPRNNLVLDQAWHFMPSLPEFTVCEECYDEVIWPVINAGSEIADMFNRTLQFPPEQGMAAGMGHSCQLYSSRMRRVFEKAVETGDLGYLIKRARERKAVEMELQSQHTGLRRAMEGKGSGYGYGTYANGGVDPDRLRAELERIGREWKEWE